MPVIGFINSFDRYLLSSKLVASGGSLGLDKTRGN